MIKKRIAQLLDKEMDRKSFLIHGAATVVAVVGTSTALKLLSGSTSPTPNSGHSTVQRRYGGSSYGR